MNKTLLSNTLQTLGSLLATPKGLLIGLAAIILLVALHFTVAPGIKDTGPSTYSISAIGHSGFFGTLTNLGRPVVQSFEKSLEQAGQQGTLIIAEPHAAALDNGTVATLLKAPKVLAVMPKWYGIAIHSQADWIKEARLLPIGISQNMLDMIVPEGTAKVTRDQWPAHWTVNKLSFMPANPFPLPPATTAQPAMTAKTVIQLLPLGSMHPIIACEEGILLGELLSPTGRIWVLADPDIMANHGIGKGDNAALMVQILDTLALSSRDPAVPFSGMDGTFPHSAIRPFSGAASGPMVFDESIHNLVQTRQTASRGNVQEVPSGNLFEKHFFALVAGLFAVLSILLFITGNTRFGSPAPSGDKKIFDKSLLIDNSARLLDYAGYQKYTLARYISMTIQAVTQKLNAPRNLSEEELLVWLDRVGTNKGISISCMQIAKDTAATVSPEDITARDASMNELHILFDNAQKIHRWKGEILNEPATDR